MTRRLLLPAALLVFPLAGFAFLPACEEDAAGGFLNIGFDASPGEFDAGTFDAARGDAASEADADAAPAPTFKIKGTVVNAVNSGLVLHQSGGDALTVAPGATSFEFTTSLHQGDAYAVTIADFPANQRCRVEKGAGTVTAEVADVVIDCSNRASCSALLADFPGTASGRYLIDPDGELDAGTVAPFVADCDMAFDDGNGKGWTLIYSTKLDGEGAVVTSTEVTTLENGEAGYLGVGVVKALANVSKQVHIRTHGNAATQSVTSKPGTAPISNLRAGHILSFGDDFGANGANLVAGTWGGPYADDTHLWYDAVAIAQTPGDPNNPNPNGGGCGPQGALCAWPMVYWAFNGSGMHVFGNARMWTYGAAASALEIYVH